MLCPVCQAEVGAPWAIAKDVEYQTSDKDYAYRYCSCGVLYLENPPIHELSTIYPDNYYSYASERSSWIVELKRRRDEKYFNRLFEHLASDELHVLDIGGGSGYLSSIVRSVDKRVTSTTIVDLDPKLQETLTKQGHIFICGSIEDLQLEAKYDVVLMFNLIEHVSNPCKILDQVKSVLKPGGLVIIQTPNFDSWDARVFRNYSWGGLHTPRHWVIFNETSLRRELVRADLPVIDVRYVQGAPFWAVSLLAWGFQKFWARLPKRSMVSMKTYWCFLCLAAGLDLVRARLGFKTSQMIAVCRA